MKSITIHALDDALDSRIREKARESQTSLNKTIKNLLAGALGTGADNVAPHRGDFEELCGAWRKRDVTDLGRALRDFEKIDAEDWR